MNVIQAIRALLILLVLTVSSSCQNISRTTVPAVVLRGTLFPTVNLEQGWDAETRQRFRFTDLGSEIVPYSWFLALERHEDSTLFRSDLNLTRYGYLPEGGSGFNPDALPIGFVKTRDRQTGEAWFGLTCAACHTGQIQYKANILRIDGGSGLGDRDRFLNELIAALHASADDDAKFQRFGTRVLGNAATPAQKDTLRQALAEKTQTLANRLALNASPSPAGHGRIDAFGNIANNLFVTGLAIPGNKAPPNAPVSYPFLWDTPQHDIVQWNGAATNTGIGSLLRNVSEAFGLFTTVVIDPRAGKPEYRSSINVKNLGLLESWLVSLRSPLWPEQVLPKIDRAKADRGKTHYDTYCEVCHTRIERADPGHRIRAVMTPIVAVETDAAMARNTTERQVQTGILQGTPELHSYGPAFGPSALATRAGSAVAVGVASEQPGAISKAGLRRYLQARSERKFNPLSYKARPLNGIWATAPYLHNGSVVSLWQLLQPAELREKVLYVGSYEFDPQVVGFADHPGADQSVVDTRLEGNDNSGHAYGVSELNDEQKWELIEYLKTL